MSNREAPVDILSYEEANITRLITQDMLHKVDPRLRESAEYSLNAPGFDELDPIAFRTLVRNVLTRDVPLPVDGVASVSDRMIDGPAEPIRVRIYTPEGQGPFPIMLYFHGGAWIAGNLDTEDNICRMCCGKTGFILVSVDYRLAPENPFPAGLQDCYAALCWAAEHAAEIGGDNDRLAVMGQSAGANLAAASTIMARDHGGPKTRHQVLISGGFQQPEKSSLGYITNPDDYCSPYASPLLASDLTDLPSATIIAAECDTTTAHCAAYAYRLAKSNINVNFYCYKGMLHGFIGDERMEACHQAIEDLAQAARKAMLLK